MEYLFIYGLQMAKMLDNLFAITLFLLFCSIFCLIVMGAGTRWKFENYDKKESYSEFSVETGRNASKAFKKLAIICLTTVIITALTPSEKTLLLMGGAYLGKKAVNEVVQSDKIEKINTIIDLQLDKYIKDLQKESINANR